MEKNPVKNKEKIYQFNKPFISVILPAYNVEKFIKKSIVSIFQQDYSHTNYEVIIINDGSTDKTLGCIKEALKDSPPDLSIRLIDIEKNMGVSSARNKGISVAKGEIIALIDSDAVARKNWISQLVYGYDEENVGGTWGTIMLANKKSKIAKFLWIFHYGNLPEVSANMSYLKEIVTQVGMFDPVFRRGGDEVVVNTKIKKLGFVIKHVPTAIVEHNLPESYLKFLRLRYIDGLAGFSIAIQYSDVKGKRIYYLKFFFKLFAISLFTFSPLLTLMSPSQDYSMAFFIIFPIILLVLILHFGGAKSFSLVRRYWWEIDLFHLIIGVTFILFGHFIQYIGELMAFTRFNNRRRF